MPRGGTEPTMAVRMTATRHADMRIRVVDLTRPVGDGTEGYPGDSVAVRLVAVPRAGGEAYDAYDLLSCHAGTHLDAPLHFVPGGRDAASLPLWAPPAVVVAARGQAIGVGILPEKGELAGRAVLLCTGWDTHIGVAVYYRDAPFLTAEAAERLAEAGAVTVGMDSPSADPFASRDFPAHRALLGAGIPIVEGLVGLGQLLGETRGLHFVAFPLRVRGTDASPVRAAALVIEPA